MTKNISGSIVAMIAVLAIAVAPAAATTVNGTAGTFNYSLDDGTSWGVPSVVGADSNTLLFNGAQFNVASTGTQVAGDSIDITINSHNFYRLGDIKVTAFGSYNLNGEGSSVDFQMSFDIQDLDSAGFISQPVVSTPVTFPLVAGVNAPMVVNNAPYSAINDLDISNNINFMGENVLIGLDVSTLATGGNLGGTSSLQVNVSALQLQFYFVPEPATMSLLAFGALALIRRRR